MTTGVARSSGWSAVAAGPQEEARRISTMGLAWFAALIGWTAFIACYDLNGGAVFEGTDCWVSQTAREMQEAGKWLVPRFSGEIRLQKSPGAYWAVMLTSLIRGGPVDEISTRIPNAVSAVIIVAVIFWLTRRIAGERAAVFAGFSLASSGLVLDWSHRGASDLGLAACITVSLASLWVASSDEPPGWKRNLLWMVGYFAAGLGMLYKMPMPLACVGVPAVSYVLIQRRWRILTSPWHLLGLVLFFLPWLPWVIAVVQLEPAAWAKWKVEFVDRFTGDLPNVEANKAWYFYFFYLLPPLIYTAPYTLSLPAALGRGLSKRPGVNQDGMRFALIWFVSSLLFFTVATGKESRYMVPALPPLFILLGVELARLFDPAATLPRWKVRASLAAVCALLPVGFVLGLRVLHRWHLKDPLFEWHEIWVPYVVTAALFYAGAVTAAWLFALNRRNAAFACVAGTTWVAWMWAWTQFMPIVASQKADRDFAVQLRTRIDPSLHQHMYQVGHQNPTVIWHSDVRYPRVVDQLKLLEMQGGERSLERERRIVGSEMIRKLAGDELALLVIRRSDYIAFMIEGPPAASDMGMEFPLVHIWLQTRVGAKGKQMLVVGNHPPPWEEPALTPPSEKPDPQPSGQESPPA